MISEIKYKQPLIHLFIKHSYTLLRDDQNTEFLTYVSRAIESMGFFFFTWIKINHMIKHYWHGPLKWLFPALSNKKYWVYRSIHWNYFIQYYILEAYFPLHTWKLLSLLFTVLNVKQGKSWTTLIFKNNAMKQTELNSHLSQRFKEQKTQLQLCLHCTVLYCTLYYFNLLTCSDYKFSEKNSCKQWLNSYLRQHPFWTCNAKDAALRKAEYCSEICQWLHKVILIFCPLAEKWQ